MKKWKKILLKLFFGILFIVIITTISGFLYLFFFVPEPEIDQTVYTFSERPITIPDKIIATGEAAPEKVSNKTNGRKVVKLTYPQECETAQNDFLALSKDQVSERFKQNGFLLSKNCTDQLKDIFQGDELYFEIIADPCRPPFMNTLDILNGKGGQSNLNEQDIDCYRDMYSTYREYITFSLVNKQRIQEVMRTFSQRMDAQIQKDRKRQDMKKDSNKWSFIVKTFRKLSLIQKMSGGAVSMVILRQFTDGSYREGMNFDELLRDTLLDKELKSLEKSPDD